MDCWRRLIGLDCCGLWLGAQPSTANELHSRQFLSFFSSFLLVLHQIPQSEEQTPIKQINFSIKRDKLIVECDGMDLPWSWKHITNNPEIKRKLVFFYWRGKARETIPSINNQQPAKPIKFNWLIFLYCWNVDWIPLIN